MAERVHLPPAVALLQLDVALVDLNPESAQHNPRVGRAFGTLGRGPAVQLLGAGRVHVRVRALVEDANLVAVAETRILAGVVLAAAAAQRHPDQPRLFLRVADRDVARLIRRRGRRQRLRTLYQIVRRHLRPRRRAQLAHVHALILFDVYLVAVRAEDVARRDDDLPRLLGLHHVSTTD